MAVKRYFQTSASRPMSSQTPIPMYKHALRLILTSKHLVVFPGLPSRTVSNVSHRPQQRTSRTHSSHTRCTQMRSLQHLHCYQHPYRRPCHSCRRVVEPHTRHIAPGSPSPGVAHGTKEVEPVARISSRKNVTSTSAPAGQRL